MRSVPAQPTEHQRELQQLDPLDAATQAIEYRAEHWATHIGVHDADLRTGPRSGPMTPPGDRRATDGRRDRG